MNKAKFAYSFTDDNILVMIDSYSALNPSMSLTNGMEQALTDVVCYNNYDPSFLNNPVVYCDTDGNWDLVVDIEYNTKTHRVERVAFQHGGLTKDDALAKARRL